MTGLSCAVAITEKRTSRLDRVAVIVNPPKVVADRTFFVAVIPYSWARNASGALHLQSNIHVT